MSYTEIQQKYITKTLKPHDCEWCGTQIEIGSEAWYRFYKFDNQKHSAYMHPECAQASAKASADPVCDLTDGWLPGDYDRGEWVSREDFRYPHRTVWEILRQTDAFDRVKVGDRVRSSITPQEIYTIDGKNALSVYWREGAMSIERSLDRDEWILDDWSIVGDAQK
jgi:hypothetical protein